MNAALQPAAAPAATSMIDVYTASCILIKLASFAPAKTRTSTTATNAARAATGSNNGRYTGHVMLKDLSKAMNAATQRARRHLDKNSCAFGEYRLVLLTDYATLSQELRDLAEDYVNVVAEHTADWNAYRQAVADECQGLWTEDLLPATQAEYLDQCELRISVMPMPSNPTSIALPAELAQQVQQEIVNEIHQQYSYVLEDQMAELADVLDDIIERMGTAKKTTASTFNAIKETVARLARFNLSNDARMAQLCTVTQGLLDQIDPKACNDSEQYRETLATHLSNIRTHVPA